MQDFNTNHVTLSSLLCWYNKYRVAVISPELLQLTLIYTENYGLTKSRTFTYDNILSLSVLYDKHKSSVLV